MADNANAKKLTYNEYTVGIICPLEVEMTAVRYMLDEEHLRLPGKEGDHNRYILGKMGGHNVVVGYLPHGSQGIGAAATVATDMRRTFSSIRLRLLVGIGGGIPSKKNDIRLGDVVVGMPDGIHGGVVQYDLGKRTVDGFEHKGYLYPPPIEWTTAVVEMKSNHKANPTNKIEGFVSQMLGAFPKLQKYSRPASDLDILFRSDTNHVRDEPTCDKCDKSQAIHRRGLTGPEIFYGTIASGDSVIKNAELRDGLSKVSGGALCFEMEAAGLANGFPCVVIRGICDYADSHKNDQWHPYAAATAAACAKELLGYIDPVPATQGSRGFEPSNPQYAQNQATLPVTTNYQKVHVVVIHWKVDQLQPLVERIFNVFRESYHYEVHEVSLTAEALTEEFQRERPLWWPCLEPSSIDEKDLQIIYYLGSTITNPASDNTMSMRAAPFFRAEEDNDLWLHSQDWLQTLIAIPPLTSDLLVVLDCSMEDLSRVNADGNTMSFLTDDDYDWARYSIMFADYTQSEDTPGRLSEHLVPVLQDLAVSDTFYARRGLITTNYVMKKLRTSMRFDTNMQPGLAGNDARGDVILVPIS